MRIEQSFIICVTIRDVNKCVYSPRHPASISYLFSSHWSHLSPATPSLQKHWPDNWSHSRNTEPIGSQLQAECRGRESGGHNVNYTSFFPHNFQYQWIKIEWQRKKEIQSKTDSDLCKRNSVEKTSIIISHLMIEKNWWISQYQAMKHW